MTRTKAALDCMRRMALGAGAVALLLPGAARGATNIPTYHYDNLRTGWNQTESSLTPSNVASNSFGLLHQVKLDQQVDTQPLFVSGQTIANQGTHDVVYVTTEGNTVYAIDANSGDILLQQNLGKGVAYTDLPGECGNNSATVGINGTPVIDLATGLMYVISYTHENGKQVFRLHELNLSTLADQVPSVVISASAYLSNGKPFTFDPQYQRQRAGMLENAGNIYAGFASFCDVGSKSRGWVIGWQAGTLTPLSVSALPDRRPKDPDNYYLSSIWMSGYGLAGDDQGNVYFITGNSDPNGKTFNLSNNLSQTAVKLSSDLATLFTSFTPSNHKLLDESDGDFGAGGIMLLPNQGANVPNLAVAAGKHDYLYLLNRDDMGGVGEKKAVLGAYTDNGCWCGPSYYTAADGAGRVVSSTGNNVSVWKVNASAAPTLKHESDGPPLNAGGDPGFFTSVSSNGTKADTAIVWATPRPADADPKKNVYLTAFDPSKGSTQIFSAPAGSWPNAANADANIVPVTANGQVFVASYKTLTIFGLSADKALARFVTPAPPPPFIYAGTQHQLYGTVLSVNGNAITLRDRAGAVHAVDLTSARLKSMVAQPSVGHATLVRGNTYTPAGALMAEYALHAKDSPYLWGVDR